MFISITNDYVHIFRFWNLLIYIILTEKSENTDHLKPSIVKYAYISFIGKWRTIFIIFAPEIEYAKPSCIQKHSFVIRSKMFTSSTGENEEVENI